MEKAKREDRKLDKMKLIQQMIKFIKSGKKPNYWNLIPLIPSRKK